MGEAHPSKTVPGIVAGMEGSRTARTTGQQVFGGMMGLTGDCHVQGPECGNMHRFCMATKLGLYVSSANF